MELTKGDASVLDLAVVGGAPLAGIGTGLYLAHAFGRSKLGKAGFIAGFVLVGLGVAAAVAAGAGMTPFARAPQPGEAQGSAAPTGQGAPR